MYVAHITYIVSHLNLTNACCIDDVSPLTEQTHMSREYRAYFNASNFLLSLLPRPMYLLY